MENTHETIEEMLWYEQFERDENNEPKVYYCYKEELAREYYYKNKYKDETTI